jgi:hypothetical protein
MVMPIKINSKTRIVFNGKEYNSIEEMPAEARQAFEQAMERAPILGSQSQQSSSTIVYNGSEFQRPEDLPPEIRQTYQKVLDSLDTDHNGIPDMFEEHPAAPAAAVVTQPAESIIPAAPLFPEPNPLGNPPANPDRRWMIAGITVLVLALVILGVFFILIQGGLIFK